MQKPPYTVGPNCSSGCGSCCSIPTVERIRVLETVKDLLRESSERETARVQASQQFRGGFIGFVSTRIMFSHRSVTHFATVSISNGVLNVFFFAE